MMKVLFILIVILFEMNLNAQVLRTSEPIKLTGGINAANAEESMPVFTRDSSTMYFVRTYYPKNLGGKKDQDIYFSEKFADLVYSNGENLSELNNKSNNVVFGMNVNNNRLYVLNSYKGRKNRYKGISYSNLGFGIWDKPIPIKIPDLHLKGDHVGFHMTYDEKALIISYEGPNSKGQEDLYVSLKTQDGWTSPQHLGNEINSSGFEMSPYLSQDWDTLYFSSNGFGGEGDVDIFYSVRQGTSWDKWSKPVNMGPTINSPKFDGYFIATPNHFYWSSNRDSELCDIWMAHIIEKPIADLSISYEVSDATSFGGADGKIDVTIRGGNTPYTIMWSSGQRKKDITNLEKGMYQITVRDSKGKTKTEKIKVGQAAPNLKTDLAQLFKLNPIYFELNSATLSEDSKYELDKLVDFLTEYPNLKVEIGAHTDCRASEESNLTLSAERANNTLGYIQKLVPNPERITAKGYGASKPISSCNCQVGSANECTDEDHKRNRRSEFVVIGN